MFDSEEFLERILEGMRTGENRPFMLELRPTNLCNLHCLSCVTRGNASTTLPAELSVDQYIKIIDEAADLGVRYVQVVGGGEPFVRREDTLRLMHRIKDRGMSGFIVTNGTLFDSPLIKDIFEMRWDAILFSVDGPNALINDFLRSKRGCFEKATSAIHEFVRLRDSSGTRTPRLDLGPVLSHYNCRHVVEMIKLGAELGMDNVVFQPLRIQKDGMKKHLLLTAADEKLFVEKIPIALKVAKQSGIRTNLVDWDTSMMRGSSNLPAVIQEYSSSFTHPWLSITCFAPWFYIGISTGGAVGPCSVDDERTHVGDVRNSSLKDIWEGPNFRSFRDSLARGELPPICDKCCGTNVIDIKKIRQRLQRMVGE